MSMLATLLLSVTQPALSADGTLTGGGPSYYGGEGSIWYISDDRTTTNGLSTGGSCDTSTSSGTGAAVVDAYIGQVDPYDLASMIWVNNTLVGGNLSVSGSTASFTPVTISGLAVQIEYHAVSSSATLRNYTSFTNTTGSDITVTVDFTVNFGSDVDTVLVGTSNGDFAFATNDRWVVSDDYDPTWHDPANTTVIYGPGSPAVTPTFVSQTVFDCWSTNGVLARYTLTVPANSTRALMFFHQLNVTSADGLMAASLFDVTPRSGDDLVEGLTPAQLSQIANWDSVGDLDRDGISDDADNCPADYNPGQSNSDNDVAGDACDPCPLDPQNDADGDGICGDIDNCPLASNPSQEDRDNDGVGDACNAGIDSDGDEWADNSDNCPSAPNPTQADSDGDGVGDACDVCPLDANNDGDGDGVCGNVDNCSIVSNSDQRDTDTDGMGDACDRDDDDDGIDDANDNCPLAENADQADFDLDMQGDVCDLDADGDQVTDASDQCLGTQPGAVVNSDGCSIAQICPAQNGWKNHGSYVRCVAHTAEDFVSMYLITDEQKDVIVSEAGSSDIGQNDQVIASAIIR